MAFHTKLAKDAGIDTVVCMANTSPCLDNLKTIKKYLRQKHYVKVLPVSAITIGREGKKLVDVDNLKNLVCGFSDDGNTLTNMKLLAEILKKNVLVMLHSEPEAKMIKKYLQVFKKVGGRIHFQHVASKEAVDVLRKAKQKGLKFTSETCPHYFIYPREIEDKPIGPALGGLEDIKAIKKALADGTIDAIASDYAPIPRPKGTGFASFSAFIALSYGLVLDGTLTKRQLKEKLYYNPLRIINGE
jgi:dihydroorotase